jgi:phage terminase small subunit
MRDDPRDSSNNSTAVAPPLTERQRRWIEEYLLDPNATQAAIRAGYSVPGARVQGVHMLTNPNIRQILAEERHARASRVQLEADRVVEELSWLGLSDIRNVVTWDEEGRPTFIASDQLSPDVARSIQRIMFSESVSSNGDIQRKIDVRLYDKKGALDSLMKHLGLFLGDGKQASVTTTSAVNDYDLSKLSNPQWEEMKKLLALARVSNSEENSNG